MDAYCSMSRSKNLEYSFWTTIYCSSRTITRTKPSDVSASVNQDPNVRIATFTTIPYCVEHAITTMSNRPVLEFTWVVHGSSGHTPSSPPPLHTTV